MFEKLQDVETRCKDLDERLCDPGVIGNRDLYLKISIERGEIAELVETYKKYRGTEERIAENKELMADPEFKELAREELETDRQELKRLEVRLKILLVPPDPNDAKNVLLEIRAGTGGEEAALFAADLFRLYSHLAERNRWKVEVLSTSYSTAGGTKEVIALITGTKVYSRLKYESGVHRVQRVPATESQGRIHTSAATVAVLPEAEAVDVKIEEKDLKVDRMRAGGPGGQSVNTTDSAVRLTHIPTGLVVICQDEKSQHKNKSKALKILSARVLEKERAKQDAERSEERRSQVGAGDRSEKIRTYNFPQDRVTDHRIGFSRRNMQGVLDGDVDDMLDALRTHFQAEALKQSQEQ